MVWNEFILVSIIWLSVLIDERWRTSVGRVNRLFRTCNRLFWTFYDTSNILASRSDRLNQFKLQSTLLQHWFRWKNNLPEFANRLRNSWQYASAQLQMLRSHLLFDKLLKIAWALQRHCSFQWTKFQIILNRTRFKGLRYVQSTAQHLKQPHTQELPIFIVGSFVVFNCFAAGYFTFGIVFFLLFGALLKWLNQRKQRALMNRLLQHRSRQSDNFRKLMINALQTGNNHFGFCKQQLWWVNEFLAKCWAPLFLQVLRAKSFSFCFNPNASRLFFVADSKAN